MNSVGIYISVPFCRQKCSYCNFASDVQPSALLPRYLDCLSKEMTSRSELWEQAGIPPSDITVDTIYLGGGTPGMLDAAQLATVLRIVQTVFRVNHPAEITIEASPENVTAEAAAAWAAGGINRVSLGVQSMVSEELRAVGRLHDAPMVARACSNLRAVGIENISVDLIAGLPKQTAGSWTESMEALLELQPVHFSIYMLEVDDDSRLGREILRHGDRYHAETVPSEEQVVDFYCAATQILRDAGFEQYEISNFALPGRQSRHNQKYWTNAAYFGFGADAHSYDGERRWANTDSVIAYVESIEKGRTPITEQQALSSREKLEERFFLGLRCREGVSIPDLEAEFADAAQDTAERVSIRNKYAGPIREFCEAGWLHSEGGRLRLTDRGVLFSNDVFAGFLLED